jgi:hypothetical protein
MTFELFDAFYSENGGYDVAKSRKNPSRRCRIKPKDAADLILQKKQNAPPDAAKE